ncbi:hypothetical protein LTS10_003370 [Elasticomyces elasticus]|nr:hypothetical protein LTS10_003370 [Elasticomyces elasticus]
MAPNNIDEEEPASAAAALDTAEITGNIISTGTASQLTADSSSSVDEKCLQQFSKYWNEAYAEQMEVKRQRAALNRAQNQKHPLLCLPAELRNKIYDLVATEHMHVWFKESMSTSAHRESRGDTQLPLLQPHNLLQVCHQIRQDCKEYVESLLQVEQYQVRVNDSWCTVDCSNGMLELRDRVLVMPAMVYSSWEVAAGPQRKRRMYFSSFTTIDNAKEMFVKLKGSAQADEDLKLFGVLHFPHMPELGARLLQRARCLPA